MTTLTGDANADTHRSHTHTHTHTQQVKPHDLRSPDVDGSEHPVDTYCHYSVMDGNKGGCCTFPQIFPQLNLVPYFLHFGDKVKTSDGGSKTKAENFMALKAQTKHTLQQVWVC